MSALDLFRFAGGALWGQRLRSGMSLIGVSIGVCSVILLTGLGEGARRYVTGQFSSLGTNLLMVVPGKNETTGAFPGIGGAPEDLTLEDADVLRRRFPQIEKISPMSSGTDAVSYGTRSRQAAVIGATSDLLEIRGLGLADGQFLPETEFDRGSSVVVLGKKIAQELFVGARAVGQVVRVGDWRMRVIGVMDSRGVHVGLDFDEVVVLPVATGMKVFNRSSLFRIAIEIRSYADIEKAKADFLEFFAERHDEEDVTILTQGAVVSTLSSILSVLSLALAGIGGISLAVAGVGIMNVMLVSVSERTFEVGLLKALGAHRLQILMVFLVEAVLLSLVGGLVGLGLGIGGLEVLNLVYPKFPAGSPPWAILLALLISSGVGVGFGLLPAARASRLDPVQALAKKA